MTDQAVSSRQQRGITGRTHVRRVLCVPVHRTPCQTHISTSFKPLDLLGIGAYASSSGEPPGEQIDRS
jgi:hypothetical protein